MMMSTLKKILVVGAGVAGPAVCYWLQKFGFTPTLIEIAPELRKGGQALDIRGVAVELARKMGILEQIYMKRTQVECGRYVDTAGNLLHEEHGEKYGFRQGEEVEIVRGDLVEILMSTIPEVLCRLNQSIVSINQNNDNVIVQFKDGSTENYDLVIGADGIHSKIRRLTFDKDEYRLFNLGSYISIFTIPNYLNLSHTEVMCEVNQKMASIMSDQDPNKAMAAFMFRSQHVMNNIRDKAEQMQFLRDIYQNFGWESKRLLELMTDSPDFYFDSVTQVKMKSWTKGRVALLGDAGYCASPLSGQGNNLALVGAYILAGELKNANGNYVHAFNRYNELLHSFVEVNQKFGAWASDSFLVSEDITKEVAEERTNKILEMINEVANGIRLPDYERGAS